MIINDHCKNHNQDNLDLSNYRKSVKEFWENGGGLMIFEDNDTVENSLSNIILKDFLNFTLHGNDPGM